LHITHWRPSPHDFGTSTAGAAGYIVPELSLLGRGAHAGIFTPPTPSANGSAAVGGGGGFRCATVRIRGADVAAGRVPRRFAIVADSATGTVSNPVELSIDLFGDDDGPSAAPSHAPPALAPYDGGQGAGAMVGAVVGVVISVAAIATAVSLMLSRRRAAVRRGPRRQAAVRRLGGRAAMSDDDDDGVGVAAVGVEPTGLSDIEDDNEALCRAKAAS